MSDDDDLSTLQILALYTLASPAERVVYGKPIAEIEERGLLPYRGLVRKGLARTVDLDVDDGEVFVLTDAGLRRLLLLLEQHP